MVVSFGNNNNKRIISTLAQAHLSLMKGKPMINSYSRQVCNKALKTSVNLVQ